MDDTPQTTTFNILFVCTGNTCRSPLAEAVALRELRERDWQHVRVASAGVAATPGIEASAPAVVVAERAGFELSAHRAQQLTPELIEWADVILAMGHSHLSAIDALGAGEKAALLGDFAAGGEGGGEAVPDPFGGEEVTYEDTLRSLRELVHASLDRLAPILHP